MQLDLGFHEDLGRRPPRVVSEPSNNLFAALQLQKSLFGQAKYIATDLMARHGIAGRMRPWHVTLFNPLEKEPLSEALVLYLKEAFSTVNAAGFQLVLDRAKSFKVHGGWAIVLCCSQCPEAIFALRRKIVEAYQQPGLDVADRKAFTPHMTLFYTSKRMPELQIREPITWTVREFSLILSLWGKTRHEEQWSWPLSP
ncbi:MAG: hypothetical protein JWM58_232 [Rhizobium sp.]|nr:hypothetical protein [Rhizobium sp.]